MSFKWNLPTKVLFGPGMLKKLHKEKLPGKKALLLISNGKSAKTNGTLATVEAELKEAGVEYVIFDKIQANPLEPTMMEGVMAARENSCDFVIGLGGGSVMDSATVIAAVAPQKEGRIWDYIFGGTGGGMKMKEKSLPYIAITTSAGTGSEVDCWGVVSNPETNEKIGFMGAYPTLAVVDPETMLSVPPKFTAYQGFDALFHCLEGYISVAANEASAMVELEAVRNLAKYLPIAVKDGSNLEARTKVAFANTLGGYSMEFSTCTSEHAIEHALSGHHQELPHGAGLIMISKAYYEYFAQSGQIDDRLIDLAKALGKENASKAMDMVEALSDLQKACGVDDLKMSDYGIKPEEFPMIAEDAKKTMGGLFKCDRVKLTDEGVIEILKKSYK